MRMEFEKNEDKNVMARAEFEDGLRVTVMTAPPESINGEEGPIVFPTFDQDVYTVVYSENYVMDIGLIHKGDTDKDVAAKMRFVTTLIHEGIQAARDYRTKHYPA